MQIVHANSKRYTCSMRITTSSVTVLFYKGKEYKQVIKTFSKNVEGCRDGSAKTTETIDMVMAVSRQDRVYKYYTSNPIPTSFFFKCNPSQSSHTID